MTEEQQKHVAKIIEKKLSFTNGWSISDKTYTEICIETAKKIAVYLNKSKP